MNGRSGIPPRTVISDPPATLTEYEVELIAVVRDSGWRTTSVVANDGDDLSFSYTTGFWLTLDQPEVILFDFPPKLAHDVLGQVSRNVQAGVAIQIGRPVDGILAGEPVYFLPVKTESAAEYLLSSQWFYRRAPFPVVQLVWSDKAGRFPWEDDFDPALAALQPDLSPAGWRHEIAQAK